MISSLPRNTFLKALQFYIFFSAQVIESGRLEMYHQYRQELTSTGDVITTVAQNPDAIGYASVASVKETVKALSVDGVEATDIEIKKHDGNIGSDVIFSTGVGSHTIEIQL